VRVVLDTNIIFQALKSNSGASFYILQLVRNRKIRLPISIPVFNEYEDVLKRPENLKQFGLSKKDIDEFLMFIAYIGLPIHIYYNFRPNLKDENDNIFIELGLASNCDYIVTKNIKDFSTNNQLKFKDLKIITPAEFAKKWREENEI
jgi:putative PIN family toxin of toxin-antitoxin system